jgi:hypothetical protein
VFFLCERRRRRIPKRDARAAQQGDRKRRQGRRLPGAILSDEDCAPLAWTSEGADAFFVCERVRKAAASRRNPQRAERAIKRGASNQAPSEQLKHSINLSRRP